jgi:hypothetical protein
MKSWQLFGLKANGESVNHIILFVRADYRFLKQPAIVFFSGMNLLLSIELLIAGFKRQQ